MTTCEDIYEFALGREIEELAKKELREDKQTRDQALQLFRNWVKKNGDLRNVRTDANFLLRFLRVKKFSVPMAEQTLLKYLNFRQKFSHLLCDMDVLTPAVRELLMSGYLVVSPFKDSQGRCVTITTGGKLDPHKYTDVDMAMAHYITYEACLEDEQTQIAGFVHVGDCATGTPAHLTIWSPLEFVKVLRWGEQSMPMRHKEMHVLNVPTGLRYVYDLLSSQFSEKMRNRFMLHNNLEELHEHVDKKLLPLEYGGDIPLSEMTELWMKKLVGMREKIMSLKKMQLLSDRGIIRRKNNNNHTNVIHEKMVDISGLTGSFRRLEVD